MKNEPAQKLEIKDFSLAVGRRPLTLRRAFGTTRWRPVVSLHHLRITRKKSCLSGEALWYQQSGTLKSFGRCEVQRDNEDASWSRLVASRSTNAPRGLGRFTVADGGCRFRGT